MSIFALVSQSLQTGEPIHQILPTTLIERLLYHNAHDMLSRKDQEQADEVSYVERVSSFEFVFFSTGITAVSQVIEVSFPSSGMGMVFYLLGSHSTKYTELPAVSVGKFRSEASTSGKITMNGLSDSHDLLDRLSSASYPDSFSEQNRRAIAISHSLLPFRRRVKDKILPDLQTSVDLLDNQHMQLPE